jgi:hypothetical protein
MYSSSVPVRRTGLVNVVFVKINKCSCMREVDAGGEGNARDARAVDFKQGT